MLRDSNQNVSITWRTFECPRRKVNECDTRIDLDTNLCPLAVTTMISAKIDEAYVEQVIQWANKDFVVEMLQHSRFDLCWKDSSVAIVMLS